MSLHQNYYTNTTTTTLGLTSSQQRHTWMSWQIFIVISSILGNTTILFSSIRYRALRIHRMIVVYMEQLAICDYMFSACIILPSAVCVVKNKWVFGRFYCALSVYISYYFYTASMLLVGAMTTSRLMLLKFPLKARSFSRHDGHIKVITTVWLVSLLYPLLFLVIDNNDVQFDYRSYVCDYRFSSSTWRLFLFGRLFISNCIPMFGLMLTTLLLLYNLCETRREARRAGTYFSSPDVVTVLITSTLYITLTLPHWLNSMSTLLISVRNQGHVTNNALSHHQHVTTNALSHHEHVTTNALSHPVFYRLRASCLYLTVVVNFFVYSLTVPSFKNFLRLRVGYFAVELSSYLSSYLPLSHTARLEERNDERQDQDETAV